MLLVEEVDEPVKLRVVDADGDVAEGLHLVETQDQLVEVAVVAAGGVGPDHPLDPRPVHLPAGQLELVVAHRLVDLEIFRTDPRRLDHQRRVDGFFLTVCHHPSGALAVAA